MGRTLGQRLAVLTVAHHSISQVIPRVRLVTAELIHSLAQGAPRLAELNHARLEVVKWSFDEAILLLVVGKKVVP